MMWRAKTECFERRPEKAGAGVKIAAGFGGAENAATR
jgi:hypothetical protein